jgi:hypothetical protein
MFAQRLDELGVAYEYEAFQLEYYVPVQAAYCAGCGDSEVYKRGWYKPDFWLPDYGLLVETKGKFTSRDRTKMQAVVAAHPEERIVLVFMADNKLSKQSTTRYSTWSEANNIPAIIVSKARMKTLSLADLAQLGK